MICLAVIVRPSSESIARSTRGVSPAAPRSNVPRIQTGGSCAATRDDPRRCAPSGNPPPGLPRDIGRATAWRPRAIIDLRQIENEAVHPHRLHEATTFEESDGVGAFDVRARLKSRAAGSSRFTKHEIEELRADAPAAPASIDDDIEAVLSVLHVPERRVPRQGHLAIVVSNPPERWCLRFRPAPEGDFVRAMRIAVDQQPSRGVVICWFDWPEPDRHKP